MKPTAEVNKKVNFTQIRNLLQIRKKIRNQNLKYAKYHTDRTEQVVQLRSDVCKILSNMLCSHR